MTLWLSEAQISPLYYGSKMEALGQRKVLTQASVNACPVALAAEQPTVPGDCLQSVTL